MWYRFYLPFVLTISATHATSAQTPQKSSSPSEVVAFVNVNVVPMDRARILKGRTVIIRNGRIARIGLAKEARVPRGALRVDGTGKYLMPALADMHTHLDSPDSRSLLQYLATGVTTVRVMNGRPHQLEWREQVIRGAVPGPTIYAACPTIYGRENSSSARAGFKEPATAGEAARLVAEYKRAGYDFIKVYSFLSPEMYAAVVKSAREQGIPVVGHVPWDVGAKGVLAAGQSSVEHLFGYLEAIEDGGITKEERVGLQISLPRYRVS